MKPRPQQNYYLSKTKTGCEHDKDHWCQHCLMSRFKGRIWTGKGVDERVAREAAEYALNN